VQKKLVWIFLALFLAAVAVFILYFQHLRNIDVPETAIREPRQEPLVTAEPEPEPQPEVPPEENADPDDSYFEPIYEEPAPLPEFLPRIVSLREQYDNPDIVGFIEIPNTNISYPVAQTGNNEFYLYHDLNWNPSAAGSIFVDYENDLYLLSDDNTIIYGHNMRNGTKFHNIRFFHNEEFFRQHTYILLDTPYRETVWDIFSFFHTTIDFCYLTTNFHTREAFYEFILELQSMSNFETDITLSQDDQILILSTCGIQSGPNRYVVVSRLREA